MRFGVLRHTQFPPSPFVSGSVPPSTSDAANHSVRILSRPLSGSKAVTISGIKLRISNLQSATLVVSAWGTWAEEGGMNTPLRRVSLSCTHLLTILLSCILSFFCIYTPSAHSFFSGPFFVDLVASASSVHSQSPLSWSLFDSWTRIHSARSIDL